MACGLCEFVPPWRRALLLSASLGLAFYLGISVHIVRQCGTGNLSLFELPVNTTTQQPAPAIRPREVPKAAAAVPVRSPGHPLLGQPHQAPCKPAAPAVRAVGPAPSTVFDLGFGSGDDSQLYLQMGYHVVAVEVNPQRIEEGKPRFQEDIKHGRLVLLHRALLPSKAYASWKTLTYFIHKTNEEWSSFDFRMGCRGDCWQNPNCGQRLRATSCCVSWAKCNATKLQVTSCTELFQRHGVPFLLKVGVGADGPGLSCISAMKRLGQRPSYVILSNSDVDNPNYFRLMRELGYTSVKVVQRESPELSKVFGRGSGPFGEMAQDCVTGYAWRPIGTVEPVRPTNFSKQRCKWAPDHLFDWHFKHP